MSSMEQTKQNSEEIPRSSSPITASAPSDQTVTTPSDRTEPEPENFFPPTTNLTRHGYVYQIPLPETRSQLDRAKDSHAKETWRDIAMQLRLRDGVGLREWEWACGEPVEDEDNDGGKGKDARKASHPYAERVKTFTYTRDDDPVFKGKKIVRSEKRRRELVVMEGEHGAEVDHPEFVPRPGVDEECEVPRVAHRGDE